MIRSNQIRFEIAVLLCVCVCVLVINCELPDRLAIFQPNYGQEPAQSTKYRARQILHESNLLTTGAEV